MRCGVAGRDIQIERQAFVAQNHRRPDTMAQSPSANILLTNRMSDDEHHETFEQAGAGASLTYPMQVRTGAASDAHGLPS